MCHVCLCCMKNRCGMSELMRSTGPHQNQNLLYWNIIKGEVCLSVASFKLNYVHSAVCCLYFILGVGVVLLLFISVIFSKLLCFIFHDFSSQTRHTFLYKCVYFLYNLKVTCFGMVLLDSLHYIEAATDTSLNQNDPTFILHNLTSLPLTIFNTLVGPCPASVPWRCF